MFKAPEGSESFYEDVVAKSEKYISIGYWDDIEQLNLRSWLTNFETPEEKYFAACLLDSLVYRSKRMVNSCIDEVVISRVPNFLRANNIEEINCISAWLERLCRGDKVPFRFIAIEDVDKKAGKSGAVLSRRVDERLNLAGHLTRKLDDFEAMNEEVKAVVLIDDFAGTGEQFANYMAKVAKKDNYHKYCYLYVPLAARNVPF
jgi:hypothetical protein